MLDAYEKALTAQPRADHRHRIEHCGICRPDIIERIKRLGVVPVSQPVFIIEYGDGFIRHLGLERAQLTYPFRTFLDRRYPARLLVRLPRLQLCPDEVGPGRRY